MEAIQSRDGIFATTRWSLILSSGDSDGDEEKARAALAELCRIYWRPAFLFVCRWGYAPEDAQDLTQDFFVMILETAWFRHADQNRGRFRSFLLASLQNFLIEARTKNHALKRGGAMRFVSWDNWTAEAPSESFVSSQARESLPAERLFDLRWAATVVQQALRRLGEECEARGRRRLFHALSSYLTAERADVSYAKLAARLRLEESAIKKQLHNLRERYRWLLRDEVAHTVANPTEVDAEIRYLCAILAASAE